MGEFNGKEEEEAKDGSNSLEQMVSEVHTLSLMKLTIYTRLVSVSL